MNIRTSNKLLLIFGLSFFESCDTNSNSYSWPEPYGAPYYVAFNNLEPILRNDSLLLTVAHFDHETKHSFSVKWKAMDSNQIEIWLQMSQDCDTSSSLVQEHLAIPIDLDVLAYPFVWFDPGLDGGRMLLKAPSRYVDWSGSLLLESPAPSLANDTLTLSLGWSGCTGIAVFTNESVLSPDTAFVWVFYHGPYESCEAYHTRQIVFALSAESLAKPNIVYLGPRFEYILLK